MDAQQQFDSNEQLELDGPRRSPLHKGTSLADLEPDSSSLLMKKPRSSATADPTLIRPVVAALQPYVPGEQPHQHGLIKLNTNENPYPPSPKVLDAIRAAVDQRLRLYPNPTAQPLREKLARLHHCQPENIVIGNGCDELLALAIRAFVEPRSNAALTPGRSTVQYLSPSYSLYPVLAAAHNADTNPVPLRSDFGLPQPDELQQSGWQRSAALTLVTTPNAPSGRGYTRHDLEALCQQVDGAMLLDETYADFAHEHALDLALRHEHVLIARTFSKAYSLCFQRVGYLVGPAPLIQAVDKIRDSYNVNGLGQIAALATLDDLTYYRSQFRKIIATRQRIAKALVRLGFGVFPSQANFLFVHPPTATAETWFNQLRKRKLLVRWFPAPATRDHLRISIGTDDEMDTLLKALGDLLANGAEQPPQGA
jgi:histidinol-phosphate aminotransferase